MSTLTLGGIKRNFRSWPTVIISRPHSLKNLKISHRRTKNLTPLWVAAMLSRHAGSHLADRHPIEADDDASRLIGLVFL